MQREFCRDVVRCHTGRAPSIALIAEAYGRAAVEAWIEIQLNDLSEFAGCKDKLTKDQRVELAAIIADTYPHYKLTEFMLFCHRFKKCEYGRFYGAVDPMLILSSLKEFEAGRSELLRQIRHKSEEEREAAEAIGAEKELQRVRARYSKRIPDAFTADAPMTFTQYQLMDFDRLDDAALASAIDSIRSGQLHLPGDISAMRRQAAGHNTNNH